MERPGATTLKGNPLTLIGPALKPGEKLQAIAPVVSQAAETEAEESVVAAE